MRTYTACAQRYSYYISFTHTI